LFVKGGLGHEETWLLAAYEALLILKELANHFLHDTEANLGDIEILRKYLPI
jgi:hypothetical protein